MYILTRYVVWEVLKYFLAALLALTLIVTFGMGFKRGVLDEGLPPLLMLQSMPILLPEMLGITIPVAMLFAVCFVFGRMTGANEVVALKSLGISPTAVVWPVLALAAFTSLGTIWMYEIAATWCRPRFARLVCESIEDIVYSRLQKRSFYDGDCFSIAVKDIVVRNGRRVLVQPTITLKSQAGGHKVTITADEAEVCTNWRAGTLDVGCRNGQIDVDDGRMRMSFPEEQPYQIPIPKPTWDHRHRDWTATGDIPGLIDGIQKELDPLQRELQTLERLRAANKTLGGEGPSAHVNQLTAQITDKKTQITNKKWLISRLRTEPFRRWSNGFTCLCFALIGMPMAMLWRNADGLTAFAFCFLPILAVYYPLLMVGEDLSTSGTLPPIAFWMGNVILAIPAVFLMRWVVRH
jgi:lipopolysaccharide export system permease protein